VLKAVENIGHISIFEHHGTYEIMVYVMIVRYVIVRKNCIISTCS
jgi:hypothetical protein